MMKSKYFRWIAGVLLVFTFFGKYSGYNISESLTNLTNLAFWVVLVIGIVLKSKGK